MLKGISPYLSPDLLKTLHEMGHGDELMLADAHFPGHTLGQRVLRADGLTVMQMLNAIMPLFELDWLERPLIMMQTASSTSIDPMVEADYLSVIRQHAPEAQPPVRLERQTFYDRARQSYAVVITGELRPYGNLILRKGVMPINSGVAS